MLNFTKSQLSRRVLLFAFIVLPSFLYSTVINIPADYATIQAGISAAVETDTILVQPGTYVENIWFCDPNITLGSLFLTTQDETYISSTIIDGSNSAATVNIDSYTDLSTLFTGFTITNGNSDYGGGIYIDNGSSATLKNLIITGNSAVLGSGIYCCMSDVILEDIVMFGNTSTEVIFCIDYASLTLNNVTISDNERRSIYCVDSQVNINNSILWNTESSNEIIDDGVGGVTVTYSDIRGGYTGTGNIESDPLFVDPANGDYHLQSTSPCIDTGDSNPQHNDPDGTRADMGAYYFHQYNGPIWHISTLGSDSTGTGSEEFPFATIQHGILSAGFLDTVLVQPGTYLENINFYGNWITVGSLFLTTQDTTYISSTIIDGTGGRVMSFDNNETSSSVLSGFTIANGGAAGSLPAGTGGGIYCDSSSPTLRNLKIINNAASFYGGGIFCGANSNPILENVTISGNTTSAGGGIYCDSSSPSFKNVTISGNTASFWGGGIYCSNFSSPNLDDVTISNNTATNSGGGIYCTSSSPSLENVTISGNDASSGGGIYCNVACDLNLSNCIMWNDTLEEIYFNTGAAPNTITISYSDIQGGEAGIITNSNGIVEWLAGNIDTDPLFVDTANENYYLQPSSPCINTGDPASTLDPDGTIADMGAYYFDHHPGNIWHISTTGSDVTGYGSELYPFATIQHGINTSVVSDTVLVQSGTYVENIDFSGKLITVGSLLLTTQDTTYISSTIIDGNGSGRVVVFENNEDLTAILCGFTITNGLASGAEPAYYGGGIFCNGASPTLQNLTISGNTADGAGGGISCIYGSSPTLDDIKILDNVGGGFDCNSSSSPILNNVIIRGNTAFNGGGIMLRSLCDPSFNHVEISGNTATQYGGGIYCYRFCEPTLENVTISGNTAAHYGGGIHIDDASNPTLVNSIVWNNTPYEIYCSTNNDPDTVSVSYSDIQGGEAGIVTNGNGIVNWLVGNIDTDPLFVNAGSGYYNLTVSSLCIDAGDPVSQLDPDGTIADMGAYYFHQVASLDSPQNVMIEIVGTDVNISWDEVTNANSYDIYYSDDPYLGFIVAGSVDVESWSTPNGNMKQFYYVVANTEAVKSGSHGLRRISIFKKRR